MLIDALVLLQAGGNGGAPQGGLMQMLPMMLLMIGVIYFLLFRPMQKQQAQHRQLLESLKKGDEVQTSGGLIGRIDRVDSERGELVVVIDETKGTRVRVVKSAVVAHAGASAPVGEKKEAAPEAAVKNK